ncbi:MAG: hypothetical protein LBG92_00140 [Prevotellaceae bacterium]|jgi:hypothetical protein|nr:hypothetical protein [Prevotellaceae bacterium]
MNRAIRNLFLTGVAACLFAVGAEAKLKGVPAIKSYKDYTLRKNSVESVKYTVYAPKQEGDKTVKGAVADFVLEVFFDDKGNRIKEIVYHIETAAIEAVTDWVYDEAAGTVTEVRLDAKGLLAYKIEYLANINAGSVNMRRYERYVDADKKVHENVLAEEELWVENPKKKSASCKKTWFSFADGIASRQSVREFDLDKPYTLYNVIEDNSAAIDCTWLYDYTASLRKTTSGKSKKESIFNGDNTQYRAKKGLLDKINTFDAAKVLKNGVVYTYVFDKNKNWTQAIQTENNAVRFIIEREIKYRKH